MSSIEAEREPEPDEQAGDAAAHGTGPQPSAEPDRGAIEAILLVTDEPLRAATLAQVLEHPVARVEAALSELAAEYTEQGRGFELREVGGGWRLYTREQYAPVVERFVLDGQQAKLTQAALETLAVVAYRQPVSRARVSAVRGVNCDGVMKTLVSRGLVTESGTDRDSGATLFVTTSYFLERLGLSSLEELPDLAPYLPDIDEMEELAEGVGGNRATSSSRTDAGGTETGRADAGGTETGRADAGGTEESPRASDVEQPDPAGGPEPIGDPELSEDPGEQPEEHR